MYFKLEQVLIQRAPLFKLDRSFIVVKCYNTNHKITARILTTSNHNKTEIGPNRNSQSVATQLKGSNPSHEKNKRYRDSSHAALFDVFGFVDETAILHVQL
jgi:hypothetical protein